VAGPLHTLLELGAGGGNTASHLSRDLRLTLTDPSPEMLGLSRTINPDSDHVVGDMRTLRLSQSFDAVLIHDAICYMRTLPDLRAAMLTAWEHLRPGGAAVFMPDHLRETFRPGSDHGGEDDSVIPDGRPGRGLRYLEWTTDPDPTDTTYQVDYAIMLRDTDGSVALHHDRHIEGLFPRQAWLDLMAGIGFEAHTVPGTGDADAFVGRRP
jgi:SAM-dependent methyltransferase